MKAWLFQDHRQKQELGDEAPWYVGWYEPDGKKRRKKIGSHSMAVKFSRKVEGQLAAGVYQSNARKTWKEFEAEFKEKIAASMKPQSKRLTLESMAHFKRIAKPGRVETIKTQTMDAFIAKRRVERGLKKGSTISPATVNKDLRHLKAVLNVAHEWGYLARVPKFRMLKEPTKLPRFITPEHFAKIYKECDKATMPEGLPYPAGDWWKALLVFCYMTGWRVGEPLALRREDLDLVNGTAITRASDNKGGRDEVAPLHDVVVEHLRSIPSFSALVFPWPHERKKLWEQFGDIQRAAGIKLDCNEQHECTPSCHVYGFHDLRRAFATQNAARLPATTLQALMRHKAFATTQRYINMVRQVDEAVGSLHVPDVLAKSGG
ncbi:MAG: tyrosine-type recombinase/integrase [Pirellulaceae bacterium]